jgi:hypothetical protein
MIQFCGIPLDIYANVQYLHYYSFPSLRPAMKKAFVLPLFSVFFLCFLTQSRGQDTKVSNVRFEDRGETISVRYDLSGQYGKKYRIVLSLSDDNGRTFAIKPETVSGDVGGNMNPGRSKEIIWQVKRDFPYGLKGSDFVFAVDAEMQKGGRKWPYFVGAAVAGGVVYFAIRGKDKSEPPATGSIVVDVPGSYP